MRYIVTGGAGFIGSHIAEHLASGGHEVIIFDNLFTGKKENIRHLAKKRGVSFVEGSVTDIQALKKVAKDADGIFHQGAIVSVPRSIKNPIATNEANVQGTLNVLVTARDSGIRKVVFASSSSVYGDTPVLPKQEDMKPLPISPYAVSKLSGEYYCRVFSSVYSLPTVCLRYFNVFGPRQDPASEYAAVIPKFITKILHDQPPVIYGDGEQSRDFTFVGDVVQANIRAMERDIEGVFNIAYGEQHTLNELASAVMELTGKRIEPIHKAARQGDIRHSLADISAARSQLGYSPAFTFRSGLEETVSWFRNQ